MVGCYLSEECADICECINFLTMPEATSILVDTNLNLAAFALDQAIDA
jgi:hypothetical protein